LVEYHKIMEENAGKGETPKSDAESTDNLLNKK
jgi:hypothetical protein